MPYGIRTKSEELIEVKWSEAQIVFAIRDFMNSIINGDPTIQIRYGSVMSDIWIVKNEGKQSRVAMVVGGRSDRTFIHMTGTYTSFEPSSWPWSHNTYKTAYQELIALLDSKNAAKQRAKQLADPDYIASTAQNAFAKAFPNAINKEFERIVLDGEE